jgi:uncharacterized protein (DUF302 family)
MPTDSPELTGIAGLHSLRSPDAPEATLMRLESELAHRGLQIFAKIDHGAGAQQAGLTLRPTLVVIFGNARGGTPLMQARQTVGIDLPLRALIWQDASGTTWLSYNDPGWIAQRHGVEQQARAPIAAMSTLLAEIAKAVTEPAKR